jgi:hypothetical protein
LKENVNLETETLVFRIHTVPKALIFLSPYFGGGGEAEKQELDLNPTECMNIPATFSLFCKEIGKHV